MYLLIIKKVYGSNQIQLCMCINWDKWRTSDQITLNAPLQLLWVALYICRLVEHIWNISQIKIYTAHENQYFLLLWLSFLCYLSNYHVWYLDRQLHNSSNQSKLLSVLSHDIINIIWHHEKITFYGYLQLAIAMEKNITIRVIYIFSL